MKANTVNICVTLIYVRMIKINNVYRMLLVLTVSFGTDLKFFFSSNSLKIVFAVEITKWFTFLIKYNKFRI